MRCAATGGRLQVGKRALIALALCGAAGLVAGTASAQSDEPEDRTVARRMAEEAAQRYEEGDYDSARDLFHRAGTLYPAPTLTLWEARALVKLGRLVEAEERYASVKRYEIQAEDPEVFRAAAKESRRELESLRKRIPTITLQLRGMAADDSAVEVRVDSRPINPALIGFPMPLDPGTRTIVVSVNKVEHFREGIELAERDRRSVDVWLASLGQPAPGALAGAAVKPHPAAEVHPALESRTAASGANAGSVQRTLGWVSVGIGAAGAIAGVVAGQVAVSKHSTLEEQCSSNACPPEYHDEVDSFRDYRALSTASYLVGGLGLAAGVTLLLTLPDGSSTSNSRTVAVRLAPGSAEMFGSF